MRKYLRCNGQMVQDLDIKVEGGSYGIKITQQGIFKDNLVKFKEEINNKDIYEVTALLNEGLDKVIDKLSEMTKVIEREALYEDAVQESHVLYKFKMEKPFTIVKEKDAYVVKGDIVEKLFRMTNFSTEEAYERFSNKLRRMGVDEELEKMGIKEGDTVRILDFEFEWTR